MNRSVIITVAAQPKPLERREQIKKKIRALRAYTLTEELGLDEQTAGKLFPLLARYDDELDKVVESRVDVHKRLVEAGSLPNAHAVDLVIEDALANQRSMRSIEDRRIADFRKVLTSQQVARILVVLPALDRKIQNQLQRVIRNGQNAGRRPRPTDDPDDDDDDADALPPPKPGSGAPRPATAVTGTLDVATNPAAHLFIDGADTGKTTPVKGLVLVPGSHRLTFVVGKDKFTFAVGVTAGEVTTVRKDLR